MINSIGRRARLALQSDVGENLKEGVAKHAWETRPMWAEVRLCATCGLRYPWYESQPDRERCPACRAPTRPLATWETGTRVPCSPRSAPRRRVALVVDNVRSAWNVGALFRTADGLGVERLYLCGITPTPVHPKVHKTALGAEESVVWEHAPNTADILIRLRTRGWQVWALEQAPGARPLNAVELPEGRVALVVGNEVCGVGPDLFPLCDALICLPMRGMKRSFNVEVAAAILLWALTS
ncbi:MAG: RNA methyltransferase [Ardenticatenia bacterium]|nr:RNA methyltransferase [Ardenticatenia bacterium]